MIVKSQCFKFNVYRKTICPIEYCFRLLKSMWNNRVLSFAKANLSSSITQQLLLKQNNVEYILHALCYGKLQNKYVSITEFSIIEINRR